MVVVGHGNLNAPPFWFPGCDVTEDGSRALLTLGAGDMRKVLNILQR